MSELRVANDHLGDPPHLRALFENEGYLFFRDVLDQDAVLAAGRQVVRTLVERGLVQRMPLSGEDDARLQDALNEQQLWERLVATPSVAAFFTQVAGAPVRFIPLARYRVMAPGSATLIHQDALLNPGFDMTTAWIPLMAVDAELGGLAVAAGSHRQGCVPLEELPPLEDLWRGAVYEPGDVVLMHEALVHTGLPNRSPDGLRLSIDVRFQHPAAPAAVVGYIAAVDAASVRIEGEDGESVTLDVDDSTLLRNGSGRRIPLAELTDSELAPGRRVIASQRGGVAVMVKAL
ncbi:ectoine hydroxylase-related dioxygenase (phytanoyl-CoA dioxygenase family) [Catenulispora sp. GP43]|uniref:phytanoyl-CoA dioxygenase family protein n=1 Tax=Catenulispora sp. GP43 TaxID=3156263 RepID=UPI00351612E3